MEDRALVSGTLEGDRAAYMTLVGRYAGLAVAAAYTFTRDIEAAEGVAAAGLGLAYTRLGLEGEESNFPAVVVAAVRSAYRTWKREKKAVLRGLRVVSWLGELKDAHPGTFREERRVDSMRRLQGVVNRLPVRQRLAVNLRFMGAMSYNRIGAAMRTRAEAISALLAKAASRVRRELIDIEPKEWA